MKQALLFSSMIQGGGKRRAEGMQHDNAISALHRKRPSGILRQAVAMGRFCCRSRRGDLDYADAAHSERSGSLSARAQRLSTNRTVRMPQRNAHETHADTRPGGARAVSLARRRKFCAMAANVNSNCAPLGPRSRRRSRRRMRFSHQARCRGAA